MELAPPGARDARLLQLLSLPPYFGHAPAARAVSRVRVAQWRVFVRAAPRHGAPSSGRASVRARPAGEQPSLAARALLPASPSGRRI